MALMIFGLLGLGFYMSDLPLSPDKLQYYAWHKWTGVSVFVLVWLRLAWRITHQPPTMPDSMSVPLQWGAHAGHFLLYALMLCIPVSGWLMSSAKGFQTVWFGVLPIPDLIGKDKLLGENLAELHEALSIGLLMLIAGHTAAAFFHHFIHKDHTLQRMWPKR
jgi:cytochrome b561